MKKRLLGALFIIIVFVPLIIIGGVFYAIGVGLLAMLAYHEMIFLKSTSEKPLPMLVVFLGLISLILLTYSNYDGNNLVLGVNYQIMAAVTIMMLVPTVFYHKEGQYTGTRALKLLGLIVFLGISFNLFISTFTYNSMIFLYLISISMFTDTFAYLSGVLIGKHKCAPSISPKKSWEGCIVGSFLGTISATFIYVNFVDGDINIITIIIITLFLSILGQLGDLFFSAMKREYSIKDYSKLIPGHGGVLDRFDNFIFVLLGYLLFYLYL